MFQTVCFILMFAQLKTQPTPLECASPNTQAPSRETSVSNGHGTPLRFGAVGGSLGQCGGWTPTELCQAVRGLCMVQKKCAWKLFHDMILENYVINWHLHFSPWQNSVPPLPNLYPANPANARETARSLRSLGRQPQTGKVQCQALQCGDHQLLASLLEGPGSRDYFWGVGLKGWLKGSDFKRLVSLMYIWYICIISFVERRSICVQNIARWVI